MADEARNRMITLLVTDRHLNLVGDSIDDWQSLEVTLRFNEPASGTVAAPATSTLRTQLDPRLADPGAVDWARRLVVVRDGQVFCAGPVEAPRNPHEWAIEGEASGDGLVTFNFTDDLALVAGRLVYPNPALAAGSQDVAEYAASDNAELILRDLVNRNAGPGALAARQVPELVLGPLAGVGATITARARFEPLGDVLRRVALDGGGLGFTTTQVGDEIRFGVYAPADLTNQVRYSRGLGNLRSFTNEVMAPTVTTAIVAGQGEGAARTIRERINAAAEAGWWRIEQWHDQRDTDATAELDQAGDEALAEGGETARIATVTVDIDGQRYGVNYQLGDRVGVETLSEVVRGVQLQATPESGEVITSIVGSQAASSDPQWLVVSRDLARRLGRVETGTDVPVS